MRKQLLKELAKSYDIEVLHTSQGEGGLYYTDSNDLTKKIDTLFADEKISVN